MDEALQAILDNLPPKPGRSKLEPYKEFIGELRRQGRSYQEIVQVLRNHCGVATAVHSVYNFVRVRERAEKRVRPKAQRSARSVEIATSPERSAGAYRRPRASSDDDVWKNIELLKQRQRQRPDEEKVFAFDEDEPLRLTPGTGEISDPKRKQKL